MCDVIKMVALDLDETLHRGVLDEDGVDGVVVTPAHARLHGLLKDLAAQGVLLALVTRNRPQDVERLFAARSDYGLELKDFVAVEASLGSKADALQRAVAAAKISMDAVVFVDDNPGELLIVGHQHPQVSLVRAYTDADRTAEELRWHPGLWRLTIDEAADIRVEDLVANTERESLRAVSDFDQYLAELQVKIRVDVDCQDRLARLADLCAKTNQFNLTVSRLSETELKQAMASDSAHVVSVALCDRLSDSGVIAVLVARDRGKLLCVDELAMSCRVMGRGLEDLLFSHALRALPRWGDVRQVCFHVCETERNLAARQWLGQIIGLDGPAAGGNMLVDRWRFDAVVLPDTVTVNVGPVKKPAPRGDGQQSRAVAQVAAIIAHALHIPVEEAGGVWRGDHGDWNSLRHIEIVFAVEEKFGVQFGEDEIAALNDAESICSALERACGR
jgi:FkbH-like protein